MKKIKDIKTSVFFDKNDNKNKQKIEVSSDGKDYTSFILQRVLNDIELANIEEIVYEILDAYKKKWLNKRIR